jgi:hypothetical protein
MINADPRFSPGLRVGSFSSLAQSARRLLESSPRGHAPMMDEREKNRSLFA